MYVAQRPQFVCVVGGGINVDTTGTKIRNAIMTTAQIMSIL